MIKTSLGEAVHMATELAEEYQEPFGLIQAKNEIIIEPYDFGAESRYMAVCFGFPRHAGYFWYGTVKG